MINEGGNVGWERFRKRQGKTLRKVLNKMRKQEKNKAIQFKRFGSKTLAPDAVRGRESYQMEAKMTSKESLNNWEHQDAVKVAEMMIKEYGQPDEVTETMLKWKKLGDFGAGEQETYIVDESIPHDFPEPHRDFLYTAKKIKVPTRVGDTLLHVTGSIIVDGLKGTVTARCGSLNANALTLGFVEDLAKGKVVNNKGIAKREYAKRIKEGPLPSWYTDKLKKHMPKDQQEQNHMCGCLMTEADGCWDGYKKAGMKKKGKKLVPNCVPEGMGAAYMPQAGKSAVPEREITSKAVRKQLNRSRNRNTMKGDLETPHVRYVHSRDKSTDYIRPEKKKGRFKRRKTRKEEYPAGAEADMNKLYKHKPYSAKDMDAMYKDHKKSEAEKRNKAKLKKVNMVGQSSPHNEGTYDNYSKRRVPPRVPGDNVKHQMRPKGMSAGEAGRRKLAKVAQGDQNRKLAKAYGIREADDDIKKRLQDKSNRVKDAAMVKKMQKVAFAHRESVNEDLSKADKGKMDQLFRMGLAKKGELALMQRAMKRGPDAMKDPKLRSKLYDLLVKLTDLVTKDGQTFVKVRQNVQRNKKELQAVKELLHYRGKTILEVNKSFELINIPEDMSGMSVSSGHKRSVKQGAGMTKKGVAAYRRRNPGSKLQTAVTTPPSKLKKGSKAAKRRKAFCSRSRSWTSERGRAARRRWNC